MTTQVVVEFIGRDRSVASTAGRVDGATSRAGDRLKSFGKFAAAGFAVAGAAAVKFGIDAIGSASDLNETLSKSEAIFGKQAPAMEQWAAGAARSAGLSQAAALAAAAGFGDMFTQIGFAGKEAANMSRDVVQLSADLGSFNNLETADVADRISAAFRGEYDSLQAVIPNINAARVESEALAATGKTTAAELTAQEKAAAVLAIVHKDGARAMGDFERTSGGLANQQKILRAQFENVQASIGQKLLPVAVKLATWANDEALPALTRLGGYLDRTLPPIFERVSSVISAVMSAFRGDVGGGMSSVSRIIEAGQEIWAKYGDMVRENLADAIDIVKSAVSIIRSLWGLFGDNILSYAKSLFGGIVDVIRGAFSIIRGIFKVVSSLLRGDWAGVWDGIKSILRGAWLVIRGIVKALWATITFAFKNGGVVLRAVFSKAWDAVKALARAGVSWVVGQIKALPGRIRAFIGNYVDVMRAIWSRVWDIARNLVRAGVAWVVGQLRALPGRIRAFAGNYVDVMRAIWSRVWDIARNLVRNGADFVVDAIKAIPGKLRAIGSSFLDAGKSLISKLWDGILAGAKSVGGFVSDLMGSIKTGINNALNLPLTISFHKGPIDIDATLIPQFARGTMSAPKGLALVGEEGPELVELGGGERIHTAAQTRRMVTDLAGADAARMIGERGRDGGVTIVLAPQFNGVVTDPRGVVRDLEKLVTQVARQLNRPILGVTPGAVARS